MEFIICLNWVNSLTNSNKSSVGDSQRNAGPVRADRGCSVIESLAAAKQWPGSEEVANTVPAGRCGSFSTGLKAVSPPPDPRKETRSRAPHARRVRTEGPPRKKHSKTPSRRETEPWRRVTSSRGWRRRVPEAGGRDLGIPKHSLPVVMPRSCRYYTVILTSARWDQSRFVAQ